MLLVVNSASFPYYLVLCLQELGVMPCRAGYGF